MIFSINLGTQEAATTVIGNQVGAMNVNLAKKYAKTSTANSLLNATLVSLTLYLFRYQIIELFTSDATLIDILISLIPITCAAFNFIDALIMVF